MTDNIGYYGSGGVASRVCLPINAITMIVVRDYGRAFFDASNNFAVVWNV